MRMLLNVLMVCTLLGCYHPIVGKINGKWEGSTSHGRIELHFSDELLTETHFHPDTIYSIRSKYEKLGDTLLLHYGEVKEVHYINWQEENRFILNPQFPGKEEMPAIDLVRFRRAGN